MLESRALISAKIESSYGVDPTIAVATDSLLTGKPTITVIGRNLERSVVLPWRGTLDTIPVGEGVTVTFDVEVRGSGTASVAPRIGRLLRACAMTEAVATTAVYTPNSAEASESVALQVNLDGIQHKVLGCVGKFKLAAKADEVAILSFEFTGLYAAAQPTAVAFPSPTFGDATPPPTFKSAAFAFQSYAALISAFEVSLENVVSKRVDVNQAVTAWRYFLSGRTVSGSLDPETVALTTFNPWTAWSTPTVGTLTCTVGQTTGNRCVITSPRVALKEPPKYGGRDGVLSYQIPFACNVTTTAGNNELILSFT